MVEVAHVSTVIQKELSRLRRFSYSLTGDKADADDLVQNVVVKLLKSGIPDHVKPVPWMLTICKNLWIDEIRSREVRMKAANDERLAANEEGREDAQSHQLETQRVLEAVSALPDNHRLALSLVAVEGMSYAEAAAILDVPIGTIMSRVARARTNLVKMFSG